MALCTQVTLRSLAYVTQKSSDEQPKLNAEHKYYTFCSSTHPHTVLWPEGGKLFNLMVPNYTDHTLNFLNCYLYKFIIK
jgi:hypothetical protein